MLRRQPGGHPGPERRPSLRPEKAPGSAVAQQGQHGVVRDGTKQVGTAQRKTPGSRAPAQPRPAVGTQDGLRRESSRGLQSPSKGSTGQVRSGQHSTAQDAWVPSAGPAPAGVSGTEDGAVLWDWTLTICWLSRCLQSSVWTIQQDETVLQCHLDFLSRREGAWKRSPRWQL
jgi:hypothetical protein